MEPVTPGPVVVVADCPTAAYLPSLTASPALARCMGARGEDHPRAQTPAVGEGGGAAQSGAACVIHLAPAQVGSAFNAIAHSAKVSQNAYVRTAHRCWEWTCLDSTYLSPNGAKGQPHTFAQTSNMQEYSLVYLLPLSKAYPLLPLLRVLVPELSA